MSAPATAAPATKRRPRRLWRWLRRLLIAALVARLLLWLTLQQLANFGAGFAGLSVQWKSASLSLLTMSAHIEDLVVRDVDAAADAAPMLQAHDVVFDLSAQDLWQGEVSIVDFSVAGTLLTLHRGPDGALQLPRSWTEQAAVALPEEEEPEPDAPPSFDLGFAVESLRLHDLQLAYVDHTTTPATTRTGTLDLDVQDLGVAERPGAASLRVHAPELCDELFLDLKANAAATVADVQLEMTLRGVRPERFELPEDVLGVLGDARVVDLAIASELRARWIRGAPVLPALDGGVQLRVGVNGREHTAVEAKFGPTERDGGGFATPLSASAKVLGVAEDVEIGRARLEAAMSRVSFTGALAAAGVNGARLRPRLEAAGWQLPPEGVDLRASVDVEYGGSLTFGIDQLEIDTSEGRRLTLPKLSVQDLRVDDGVLAIDRVDLVGPTLDVTRTPDGSLRFAGLTKLAQPGPPAGAAPAAAAATAALPKLRIGSIAWSDADLSFTDLGRGADAQVSLADLDLRADALAFGVEAPPGRATFAFRAPGAVRKGSGDLTIAPRADGAAAQLQLNADGVTLQTLRPWLEPAGIEPALEDGDLTLVATADLRLAPELRADLELSKVRLQDGETTWLALRSLRVTGLEARSSQLELGAWSADRPTVQLHRDANGRLEACGLRFGASTGEPTDEAAQTPVAPPSETAGAVVSHGGLSLREAAVRWSNADASVAPFGLLGDLTIGPQESPTSPVAVVAELRVEDTGTAASLSATMTRTPTRFAAAGTLQAAGLDQAGLGPLLPEGWRCTLADGAARAEIDVDIDGGLAASLRGLTVTDGEQPLAELEEAALDMPQNGAEGVHVRRLVVSGLRADLARDDEELLLPGVAIAAGTRDDQAAGDPTEAAADGSALVLPPMRLDEVEVELTQVRFHDGDGQPLTLSGRLQLAEPWADAPGAESHSASNWRLRASAAPAGASVEATITASPFEMSPTLDAALSVTDVDTHVLAAALPTLGARGEARALRLDATLHARLDLRRRDAGRFDLARPFGGELVVEDLVLDDGDGDERGPFLRVDELDVIARAVDLRGGDLLLRSVDVDGPRLRLERDADGLHVAGFVLPNGGSEEAPLPAETQPAADAPAVGQASAGPEVAVDRLRVMGLDLDFQDPTTQPPTHLRAVDTDAELTRFSTNALTSSLPLSFSVTVRGGDVELEERVVRNSVFSGLLRSGAAMMTGGRDRHEIELRPMVDQVAVDGQVTLWPRLTGRVNAAVDRLELAAFRGLVKRDGVDLADGLYDARVQLDFKGYDGVDIRSDHVFTWLMLDEPPNGPISTYLRLPAPLQTVLFLLRNNNDEQRIPLNVKVPPGEAGRGAIVDAVVEGLAKMIGSSVASAGSRATSTITGALFGRNDAVPEVHVALDYEPGSPLAEGADLEALLAALEDDQSLVVVMHHALGAGDVPHARALANPSPTVLLRTIRNLQARRDELEAQRAPIAQDVVALYGAGKVQEAIQRQEKLQVVEDQLGELLDALGQALDQLDDASPRAAARRTRAASRSLAEARLDGAAQNIRKSLPDISLQRFERRPGRTIPADGLRDGGRVVLTLRRRSAQAPIGR